ncbi:MAG: hypothetical protein HYW26_00365 [Candidatus Aenigmarchaeota archaeon]|nr:hypothetical protein [Candidatus Aenigmarchaeota archaeon]
MEEEAQILESLKAFEKDFLWLTENKEAVRKEYKNEYVAVKDGKVIETDKKLDKLIKKLKKRGENPAELVIKFIPEKDFVVIW